MKAYGLQEVLKKPGDVMGADGAPADAFGHAVAIDGDIAVVGAYNDYRGSVYVFERSAGAWTLQQKLTPADVGNSTPRFGQSVAIQAGTIAVGAPYQNSEGAVYVFVFSGGLWVQQAQLQASDKAASDRFGSAVALAGDTLLVGAPYNTINGAATQGAAYAFSRSNGAWTQQKRFLRPGGQAGDQFGTSVAMHADTAIIGAPRVRFFSSAYYDGAADVFVRDNGNWSFQAELSNAIAGSTSLFGTSLALEGDTAVVGSLYVPPSVVGGARIYSRNGAVWTQMALLIPPAVPAAHGFATALAISGDTVVVGTNNPIANGSAYVFTGAGANWAQQAELTVQDGEYEDHFGTSVAISGDTVLAGIPSDDIFGNVDQGSGAVFLRTANTWTVEQAINSGAGNSYGNYGAAVALSGTTAAVGDSVAGLDKEGKVFVFEYGGAGWGVPSELTATDAGTGDNFGAALAMVGDTLVIGAPLADAGENDDQGAVYVFVRSGAMWMQVQKLQLAEAMASAGDYFGTAVALSGNTLVVGASGADGNGIDQGKAYVFVHDGASWIAQAELIAPDAAAGDQFGVSVAVDVDRVVVGAHYDDVASLVNRGSAHVFVRVGNNWTHSAQLLGSTASSNAYFGAAAAISGNTIAVSAQGKAFVYALSNGAWSEQAILPAAPSQYLSLSMEGNSLVTSGSGYNGEQARLYSRLGVLWSLKQIIAPAPSSQLPAKAVAISGGRMLVGDPSHDGAAPFGNPNSGIAYALFDEVLPTTTTISAVAPSFSLPKESYVVSVKVAAAALVSGMVVVSNDTGTCIATLNINNGQGSCSLSSPAAGIKTITAEYQGNLDFGASSTSEMHEVRTADYGDAPDSYATAQQTPVYMPRHGVAGPYLGVSPPDAEADGQPSPDALADDGAGIDDEDALAAPIAFDRGQVTDIVVNAGTAGVLNAFVDWNRDGDMGDAGEKIANVSLSAGDNLLGIQVPQLASPGVSFLRLRFSSAGGLDYFGPAPDGELEDHQVTITDNNSPPTLAPPLNTTMLEGQASGSLAITIGDAETSAGNLSLTVSSSNQTLVSNGSLAAGLGGSGANRTLVVMPATDAYGFATITLMVTDNDGGSSTATFGLTVTPVNDAPSMSLASNPVSQPGSSGAKAVSGFVTNVGFGPNESAQSVAGYNVMEISDPSNIVSGASIATDGTLTYTLSGATGIAELTASVSDNGGVANGGVDTSSPLAFQIAVLAGPTADLQIAMSDQVDSVKIGEQVVYDIVVANAGPDAVIAARVQDALPALLDDVSWVCQTVMGAQCSAPSGVGNLDVFVDLPSDSSLLFQILGTVLDIGAGTLTNTASVAVPAGVTELAPGNNTASDVDTITLGDSIHYDGFEN